jgi:hypothetical protein
MATVSTHWRVRVSEDQETQPRAAASKQVCAHTEQLRVAVLAFDDRQNRVVAVACCGVNRYGCGFIDNQQRRRCGRHQHRRTGDWRLVHMQTLYNTHAGTNDKVAIAHNLSIDQHPATAYLLLLCGSKANVTSTCATERRLGLCSRCIHSLGTALMKRTLVAPREAPGSPNAAWRSSVPTPSTAARHARYCRRRASVAPPQVPGLPSPCAADAEHYVSGREIGASLQV